MASIKDVAKKAGVSISTVSHAMRGTKFVSEELKSKVKKAVDELGYEVNPVASSLKSKTTNTIGIVIPNINRIFFPQVIKGIQEKLSSEGYNVTLCDSDDSLKKETHFVNMLKGSWVDGIIIDSVAEDQNKDYLEKIASLRTKSKNIPVVSLERKLEGFNIDSIMVDNYHGGKIATKHLIEKDCKNIVHITGPRYSCMVKERLKGFKEVATAEKVKHHILTGDFSPKSGYNTVKKLLKKEDDFDGIFAANDQMAVGALKALKEKNIEVPVRVKVVGYDNTFVASVVSPSLTTIHVPKYEMGCRAAELLMKRIRKKSTESVNIELPTKLIVRDSTEKNHHNGWELFGW